ncbi:Clp protease N-terminal domain-containing protein [Amycolatopsis endophytica]|uniref:ATP-dependent Clp protease ATP-binding subunit ClpA n=1 Tax=Amycolatopsis endophytica TaxID=860233 RepID=A0A853AZM5_9PSEU|nr:Clp protease N-terminal domain-containing protein [Amycolatopsis endophytica]NYI88065.1 ATP-dependent Clp protease ATP-binding subunit ClpA [Amycolatopsis endophytica]
MFEKFTADARELVVEAQRDAIRLDSPRIDPLHLLVALLHFPEGKAARLLTGFGVALDDVAAETARVRRRGGITEADAEALGEFGIDVDTILDRVEQAHGPNALAGRHGRRRGHIPFADESKKVLQVCLKEVISLGGKELGTEHILLALTALRGPAADVLARFEVDARRVRQALA